MNKYFMGALDLTADRSDFECGVEALDLYLRTQVNQDIKRRVSACFVARHATGQIAGYYTLSSASVALSALPEVLTKSCLVTRVCQQFVWDVWQSRPFLRAKDLEQLC